MPKRPFRKAFLAAIPFLISAFPSFAQFVPNRYILLLEDPPVAARFQKREEMRSAAGVAYRAQIETTQKRIIAELASRKIQVTGSVSTTLNAIFVTATSDRIDEMKAIPGVAAVRPVRRYKANLNKATQLMNAPAAWNAVGGQSNAGKGIKIAILDSGIDQTHPAFQDSSLSPPSGFPICSGFSGDCSAYTNSKVIVARSYVKQLAGFGTNGSAPNPATSTPDDYTPRDHLGHGTAVASAAAASQNSGTVAFTGMAPKAFLGNYKIAGTPGVNDGPTDDVMIQAIEDALHDGMDIASLSWGAQAVAGALDTGAACGLPAGQPCDPVAAAFEAAAQAGLVITVAAGNSGGDASLFYNENYPGFNTISSPASAPSVLGVGATANSHVLTPSVSVNASNGPKKLAAQLSDSVFYPSAEGANQAPLIDITKLGNDGLACVSLPAGSLNNAYALIERGSCNFGVKASNAQLAGAIGIVFYMADSSPTISPIGLCPSSTCSSPFTGPAVMISNGDGLNLKSYVDANPNAVVTIDSAGIETDIATIDQSLQISPPIAANQLASYSSFGPTPDGAIKPDLVAVGGADPNLGVGPGLYLAAEKLDPNGDLYSVNGYSGGDGTSFAAPIVAGAAALVKQAHPSYTAADIRSALVNSTAQDTTTDTQGIPVDVEWLGAGRLDAGAASSASVTSTPAIVSFGFLKTGATLPTRKLTITNRSSASVTLAVAVAPNSNVSGITVTADQTSLTIAAGSTATLNMSLTGSVPGAGSYSGAVTLKASNVSLRIPYLFIVPAGTVYNVLPLSAAIQGTPGADGGTIAIQVVDQYGAPVAGSSVSFSASRGAVTFGNVTGGGTTSTCSPANSSNVSCTTDNYGVAYAEVILGSSTGSPTITATASGNTFTLNAFILPQPAITAGQILDNASFQAKVAPGSIVAIKGANLMDLGLLNNTTAGYDLATTNPWPLGLDGVNVSFDIPGAGISLPAPIVAVSAGQINVQVPWELKGQSSAQVKVILDESFGPTIYSTPMTATLADYVPAFFTNSGTVADALDTSYNVITSSNPAVRGQTIQLFANGLGPVNNPPADGAGSAGNTSTTSQPCTVSIGGQQVTPSFCGLAPGFAIYQVNVQVPTGISAGNAAITISIGGQTSPSGVVIPVK